MRLKKANHPIFQAYKKQVATFNEVTIELQHKWLAKDTQNLHMKGEAELLKERLALFGDIRESEAFLDENFPSSKRSHPNKRLSVLLNDPRIKAVASFFQTLISDVAGSTCKHSGVPPADYNPGPSFTLSHKRFEGLFFSTRLRPVAPDALMQKLRTLLADFKTNVSKWLSFENPPRLPLISYINLVPHTSDSQRSQQQVHGGKRRGQATDVQPGSRLRRGWPSAGV